MSRLSVVCPSASCSSVCRKHSNMLLLLLHTFTSVCVLAVHVSAVTTDTVVGVAGRRVTLPCRSEAVNQDGVAVCWGRGEPSLFNCHNTVINAVGDQVSYRRSYRFFMSSSSSLTILSSRPSDGGFYHCRVQLPGLFNDQTTTVHLIIITPRAMSPEDGGDTEDLDMPHSTTLSTTEQVTNESGSDVSNTTEPMVALVQVPVQQQQVNNLEFFITNTVRASFIIFIPALLLTAAYSQCMRKRSQRPDTDRRPNQSEEEIYSSV